MDHLFHRGVFQLLRRVYVFPRVVFVLFERLLRPVRETREIVIVPFVVDGVRRRLAPDDEFFEVRIDVLVRRSGLLYFESDVDRGRGL